MTTQLPFSFWLKEDKILAAILVPRLTEMALSGMKEGSQKLGIGFDYNIYNELAAYWAKTYTDLLMEQLKVTSEHVVGPILHEWISTKGSTRKDLLEQLTPHFGPIRADRIATTETTRAFASGERIFYEDNGIERWRWNTNNDELVCPHCGGINRQIKKIGESWGMFRGKPVYHPPFHVNCRCWVSPVVQKVTKLLRSQSLHLVKRVVYDWQPLWKGEAEGHPFRGNQYTGAIRGSTINKEVFGEKVSVLQVDQIEKIDQEGAFAVAVKGRNKGEILFSTKKGGGHEEMIYAFDEDDVADNYVRFYTYKNGGLSASLFFAGIQIDDADVADIPRLEVEASDNIARALRSLISKGMPHQSEIFIRGLSSSKGQKYNTGDYSKVLNRGNLSKHLGPGPHPNGSDQSVHDPKNDIWGDGQSKNQVTQLKDKEGHPFRGNQYTEGQEAEFDYAYELEDEEPLSKAEKTVLTVFNRASKGQATEAHIDNDFREDEIVPLLSKQGKVVRGKTALNLSKDPTFHKQACHENTALLAYQGRISAIGTGYAFNKSDNFWAQHSWGYDEKGRIIETTIPRDVYLLWGQTGRKKDESFYGRELP